MKFLVPLTLRSAAGAASVPPHGNGLLVLDDIAEEGKGTLKAPSVDSLGSLAGVLERGAEVAAASPGGLCVVDRGGCVADLRYQLAGVAMAYMRDVCSGDCTQSQRRRATYHRDVRRLSCVVS